MYVELNHINKRFGNYQASDDVSFGIEKGKLIGLLGPSGSGKTTILRMIAGLEHPDSGEIKIDGTVVNDIPASKRGIGFVFQNYALFRYMTVYDNIAFGLKVQKVDRKTIASRVAELIDLIGLKGLEKRYPSQLSGGQRQRVAFARALAPNPQLSAVGRAVLQQLMRKCVRSCAARLKEMIGKLGVTSIFVTHDQDEAIEVADEIIITNRGRIEQMDDRGDHRQSADLFHSFVFRTHLRAGRLPEVSHIPADGTRGKGNRPSGVPENHQEGRGTEVRQFCFSGRGGTGFFSWRLDRAGSSCERRFADCQA